jgi:hypothetical protein
MGKLRCLTASSKLFPFDPKSFSAPFAEDEFPQFLSVLGQPAKIAPGISDFENK